VIYSEIRNILNDPGKVKKQARDEFQNAEEDKIMNTRNKSKGQFSRRRFIGYTAAAAAYSFLPGIIRAKSFSPGLLKPDSTFRGVPIGAITYSFRSLPGTNAEETLDYLLQCGLSHCELMSGPIQYLPKSMNICLMLQKQWKPEV